MRIFIKTSISRSEIGDTLFDEICAMYPSGAKPNRLAIDNYLDVEAVQNVLNCLASHHWFPRNPLAYVPNSFRADLEHIFSDGDLAQAKYLVLTPEVYSDGGRTKEGVLILESDPSGEDNALPPGEEIVSAGGAGIAVSDRLRRLMEQEHFNHAVFKELILSETYGPDPRIIKPFWQLTSDFVMPSLSPKKTLLLDEANQPYDGDPKKPYFLWGGLEVPDVLVKPVDLYYDEQDVANLEPFDIALTREKIGGFWLPFYIISQRFYQFCVKNGLKVSCRPVFVNCD